MQRGVEGKDHRSDRLGMRQSRGLEEGNQGSDELRRLRTAGEANPGCRAEKARLRSEEPPLRAFQLLAAGAFSSGKDREPEDLRRDRRQARPGQGLRHLQAGSRLYPRLVLERDDPQAQARAAAGYERPLPRQFAEGRHLLHRAARAGRRDHPAEADRARRNCRSSGRTWSTPASSPGMPTARRCAP